MSLKYIYVAGPITKGDQALNVRMGMDAATLLMDNGYIPFVPQLSWFWHLCNPADYEQWMKLDLEWIKRCDALLRLPGESKGADVEVTHAMQLKLQVFAMTAVDFLRIDRLQRNQDEERERDKEA